MAESARTSLVVTDSDDLRRDAAKDVLEGNVILDVVAINVGHMFEGGQACTTSLNNQQFEKDNFLVYVCLWY